MDSGAFGIVVLALFAAAGGIHLARRRRADGVAGRRLRATASIDATSRLRNQRGLLEDGMPLLARAAKRRQPVLAAALTVPADKADAIGRRIVDGHPGDTIVARTGATSLACLIPLDPYAAGAVDHAVQRLTATVAAAAPIGLARSDRDGGSLGDLLGAAVEAITPGRTLTWYDPAMTAARGARDAVLLGLRHAIAQGEIEPYFEPCVDLATGELLGFEVLARWAHPVRGLILPDRFIALAEGEGLIADLSLTVMRQAFVAARDWDAALFLSVNLSPVQLRDPSLAEKLIRLLAETGFPATRLEVEVTEQVMLDPEAIAPTLIGALKAQGVRLTLDDFGAGVTGLSHLRALPFDRIKIDRSIVSRIADDPERAAVVDAIVRLGANLALPVSAEGVETAHVAERLRAIGCTTGQGYFHGRPLPLMQARTMLAERRLVGITNRRQAG